MNIEENSSISIEGRKINTSIDDIIHWLFPMKLPRLPREARRTRKPLQDNWTKYPSKTYWIQCTYQKCNYYWRYSGGKNWAECPICHSISKVSVARKYFKINNPELGEKI